MYSFIDLWSMRGSVSCPSLLRYGEYNTRREPTPSSLRRARPLSYLVKSSVRYLPQGRHKKLEWSIPLACPHLTCLYGGGRACAPTVSFYLAKGRPNL